MYYCLLLPGYDLSGGGSAIASWVGFDARAGFALAARLCSQMEKPRLIAATEVGKVAAVNLITVLVAAKETFAGRLCRAPASPPPARYVKTVTETCLRGVAGFRDLLGDRCPVRSLRTLRGHNPLEATALRLIAEMPEARDDRPERVRRRGSHGETNLRTAKPKSS